MLFSVAEYSRYHSIVWLESTVLFLYENNHVTQVNCDPTSLIGCRADWKISGWHTTAFNEMSSMKVWCTGSVVNMLQTWQSNLSQILISGSEYCEYFATAWHVQSYMLKNHGLCKSMHYRLLYTMIQWLISAVISFMWNVYWTYCIL